MGLEVLKPNRKGTVPGSNQQVAADGDLEADGKQAAASKAAAAEAGQDTLELKPKVKGGKKRKAQDSLTDVDKLQAQMAQLKRVNAQLKASLQQSVAGEAGTAPKAKRQKKAEVAKAAPAPAQSEQVPAVAGADISSWKHLQLAPQIEAAIAQLGFSMPTPIQEEALLPAIRDRRDIIGAAQTVRNMQAWLAPAAHQYLHGMQPQACSCWCRQLQCLIKEGGSSWAMGHCSRQDAALLEARQLTSVLPASDMIMLLQSLRTGNSLQGSGKTLAFGLPIMQLLMAERQPGVARRGPKDLKALVLAPTRELALQVGLAAAKHRLLAPARCSHVQASCLSYTSRLIHPSGLLLRTTASSQEASAQQGRLRACRCVTTCRRLGSPAASGWSRLLVASAWPSRSASSGSSRR